MGEAFICGRSGGGDGKRTTRFTVGTSTAGWTSADCDYLCDGTADQAEINAAITALPATGGEIVILDGTYNVTAKIDVTKDNVTLRGNGNATILKRMFTSSSSGVITLTSVSGCKIADLQVDGNMANYYDTNHYGIYLLNSDNNTITGNTCKNSPLGSIYLASSNNNIITGNTCNDNKNGIDLGSGKHNTIIGNVCDNNTSYGIYITGADHNTITGNVCNNNYSGIYLLNSDNNTITGNTCIRGTGLETDYSTYQHTINLKSAGNHYNLIANNNCLGKAVTNEGGTGNTLVNNKYNAT